MKLKWMMSADLIRNNEGGIVWPTFVCYCPSPTGLEGMKTVRKNWQNSGAVKFVLFFAITVSSQQRG